MTIPPIPGHEPDPGDMSVDPAVPATDPSPVGDGFGDGEQADELGDFA